MTDPIHVLLVDDNPADIELAQESFLDCKVRVSLHAALDGVEAMAFLRRKGAHAEAPRPDLILLDLNLTRLDGQGVLKEIKTDPDLRRIPVVVLSSSAAESDVIESYDLGANCYIQKPVDLEQFEKIMHALEAFWLTIVKLPPA